MQKKELCHYLRLSAFFFFFCRLRLKVTGPIETLKEELVCLKTLFKNTFKAEQITSTFQNRLAYTCKDVADYINT